MPSFDFRAIPLRVAAALIRLIRHYATPERCRAASVQAWRVEVMFARHDFSYAAAAMPRCHIFAVISHHATPLLMLMFCYVTLIFHYFRHARTESTNISRLRLLSRRAFFFRYVHAAILCFRRGGCLRLCHFSLPL